MTRRARLALGAAAAAAAAGALLLVFAAYRDPHLMVQLSNAFWSCFQMHAPLSAPSPWVRRWAHLVRPGGTVLDLACGSGRHLRWLAAQGFAVTGVDRDADALAPLASVARTLVADLERDPWPLAGQRFDAVLVTNYLWRPRFPELLAALADDGVLIYETFAEGQQALGRPSRPDFLLQGGELLRLAAGLQVVAYEDGRLEDPPRRVQRIAAVGPLERPDRIRRLKEGP